MSAGIENGPMKKILILSAFVLTAGLTLFGLEVLLESPYAGIEMRVCGDAVCVTSVDRDGPAYGKVEPGDHLVGIDTLSVPYFAFSSDPDYIASRQEQKIFWDSQRSMNTFVRKDHPTLFVFTRKGQTEKISLTPVPFPLMRAITATLPQYCVGWTFILIAYLVFRKKESHLSATNLIIGVFAGAAFITLAPYSARDIAFPYTSFKIFTVLNYIATQTFCYALLHIALLFPRKKVVLQRYPRIVAAPYILLACVITAHYAELFDNTYLTTYMSMNACLLATLGMFIFDFLREKNPLYRKQTQWVVIGSLAGISSWLVLTSLPIVFGIPHLAQEISILPTVIYPLSFAFAVTRYRLMEIDTIIDTAVVYGFTIIVLAGIETTFLSFASPYLLTAGKGLPALSVIAVLLIVFIYVPIRNVVKGLVERVFKRGKYDPEQELQRFMMRLGLCDERSALEKFTFFATDLLRPSGIVLLKIEDRTASILYAKNDHARQEGIRLLSRAGDVWEHIRDKGTCTFGYELSDAVGSVGALFTPEFENSLLVPFITDLANAQNGYLAVLLKKWNETAYSIKDVTLLNAISVNIANIIEAGELRKERAEIEERFRKEKDAVMKELHDGLGNILTSITVTSQAAEKLVEGSQQNVHCLIGRIAEFSDEAVVFLRTGLTVLDNPRGDIGSLMEGVKDRFSPLFESAGMDLKIECADEVKKLRTGAAMIMNLARVIQESLANIIKHSGAQRAHIAVERANNGVTVMVTDDGKGFDIGELKAGYGLANMRRRVEDMTGNLEIIDQQTGGTKIRFTVPLAGNAGKEEGAYAAGNR
jgi:signal transduction histidine kinase